MDDIITAVTASKSGHYLLVNQSFTKPRIELLQFDSSLGIAQGSVVQKYNGHQQTHYVLKPQFGGNSENLVLCGSEDCGVYVWARQSGDLLFKVKSHYQVTNSVSWSPLFNSFISGSDDTTVKLWTKNSLNIVCKNLKPLIERNLSTRNQVSRKDSSESDGVQQN